MKKQLLVLIAVILSLNSYSQISFEKGYYIDNANQKTNCLIKNLDWKNNPNHFEYKLAENGESEKLTIKSVKEFGINNVSKFIRETVNIDRSSENIHNLSKVKNPIFQEEELFLKVLLEGEASLYAYEDSNLKRYFYSKEGSELEQLIYKKYSIDNNIGLNNRYRQQLWSDLQCSSFKLSRVENIDYKKNELLRLFIDYNKCNNLPFTNFEDKQKKNFFHLSVRPGVNYSSLSIMNYFQNNSTINFDNEFRFRFGVELEFILPFNKNKWALITEPTYQYFNSEKETTTRNAKADYKSIELPIGIRHYFFLNKNSKIFINGAVLYDFSGNSKIAFDSRPDLDITTSYNLAFGFGYKLEDRYSLELRHQTNRQLLGGYSAWSSDYHTMAIIIGYSLF